MSACMHRTRLAAVCVPLALVAAANGQILSDGDFEALSVGTPPDCATPAGAWAFPANYVTLGVCEALATEAQIVTDPTGRGNSLHYNHDNAGTNVHLPNVFNQVINEEPGLIVSVQFDVWIATAGVAGGSLYIGGDHGGGGFSNLSDRGPQLTFQIDGRLTARNGATGLDVLLVTSFPVASWQTIRLDIDMSADTFDASTGPQGGSLVSVGTGLPYRSPPLDHLDRFTMAHFGGLNARAEMFLDNVSVERVGACPCACDFDPDPACDIFDFLAFQNLFVGGDPCACEMDPDPACDIFDFLAFQNQFVGGCP